MQRDNEQVMRLLKPALLWLIAAVSGSIGGAALVPNQRDPSDVFNTKEWSKIEEKIQQLDTRTQNLPRMEYHTIPFLEYQLKELKVVCEKK